MMSIAAPREDYGGIILFVAVLSLLASVQIIRSIRSNPMSLPQLAAKFGGSVVRTTPGNASIRFSVDDVPVSLRMHAATEDSTSYTRLRFRWVPPGMLHIAREPLAAKFGRDFSRKNIPIGDPDFDRQFIVQGHPESWVRRTLSPLGVNRFTAISRIGRKGLLRYSPTLLAGASGVWITLDADLSRDTARLAQFLGKAIGFFHLLRTAAEPEGMKILSAEVCAAQGRCPVCSNEIGDSPHACPDCGTAHHDECWEYLGGCATYACGQKSD